MEFCLEQDSPHVGTQLLKQTYIKPKAVTCSLWDCSRNKTIFSFLFVFRKYGLSTVLFAVPSYLLLKFLVYLMSGRPYITVYTIFFGLHCSHLYCVGTLKWVTPCDPSFANEVCGYLQGFSNVESKIECETKWPQHKMSCGRVTKPKSLKLQVFIQTNILIVSSCLILENNTNYLNFLLCFHLLMKQ